MPAFQAIRQPLTAHSYKFNSFTDCVRHTYKTEGLHGFYRGRFNIFNFPDPLLINAS